jgi:hypothetical protein
VHLDAGEYILMFHIHSLQGGDVEVYGVAATGNTLPDYTAMASDGAVLGYSQLPTTAGADQPVSFTVPAEGADVTIGWVYNTAINPGHGLVNYRMSGIDLYRN